MNETASCNDAALGPVVQGCRDDFDFTLAFEQYIFTLVPAVVFLLVAPLRIASLRKTAARVEGQFLRVSKLVSTRSTCDLCDVRDSQTRQTMWL